MLKDSPEPDRLIQDALNGELGTEDMAVVTGDELDVPEQLVADPQGVLDEQELKGILEALLYVSHEPLSLDKLVCVMDGPSKLVVNNALYALQCDYDQEGRGLHIVEVAGGFLMATRADCASWIKRLQTVKVSPKVSRSALETLAIIAYKQPIVRADIEQIRGVETSGVIRTLLDQKLVRIVGRKDVPGRPIMYGTSKHFLQRFGLRDLRDLPPLREFTALGEGTDGSLFDDGLSSMEPASDEGGEDRCESPVLLPCPEVVQE